MSDKNGGLAFPGNVEVSQNLTTGETIINQWTSEGMTLRDYFAAKAMQAVVQATSEPYFHDNELLIRIQGQDQTANIAYTIADAMLKAREQS